MTLDPIDTLWLLLCCLLVLLQQAGFLCLESGLTRPKNNVNVAFKNFADACLVLVVFWYIGFYFAWGESWQGIIGLPFIESTAHHPKQPLFFIYQALFCCTSVTLVSGAVSERLRFKAYLLFAFLISLVIYPAVAHWVWHPEGWLHALGFKDYAGGLVVHGIGGACAFAILLVIGPRSHIFAADGTRKPNPASNMSITTLGVILLWLGWLGFNGGSTGKFSEVALNVILVTLMAGACGFTLTIALEMLGKHGKVRIDRCLNGALAGLVCVTPVANLVSVNQLLIVVLLGVFAFLLTDYLLIKNKVDDVVSAVPVHLAPGSIGILLVPVFSASPSATFGVQLLGLVACLCWAFSLTYLFAKGINAIYPIRISAEEELQGLNIVEHGVRSDLTDILRVMQEHEASGNFTCKMPEMDTFTESGLISRQYSRVVASVNDSLQKLDVALNNEVNRSEELEQLTKALTQANHQLDTAKQTAESALAVKDRFLSIMQHEINTPLNSIIGFTKRLQKLDLDDRASSALDILEENALRLSDLMQKIMLYTDPDSHLGPVNLIRGSLAENLQPLMDQFAEKLSVNNRQLSVHYSEKCKSILITDIKRIIAIINELLTNSLVHASAGNVDVDYAIEQQGDNDTLVICITDQGPGIELHAEDLFKPFVQKSEFTTRNNEGAGLGLAIVRRLVEQLNGEIRYHSDEELGGAKFTVSLPVSFMDH